MLELLQQASGHVGDKISVIIPCYNREKYIAECLDSIFAQTIPLEMLEVIVVDDMSTDRTREILMNYEKRYPDNLMLVFCEEQSGGYIGAVRNMGLSYAGGAYIAFVDSDDTLEPDMLVELYKNALLYQTDIVCCGYRVIDDQQTCLGEQKKQPCLYDCHDLLNAKALYMQEGLSGYVWAKLYRREFLDANRIVFPEDRHLSEDSFFHALSLLTCEKYMCLEACLYNYRYNTAGVWNSDKAPDYIMECFHTQEELMQLAAECAQGMEREIEWGVYGAVYGMMEKCGSMHQEQIFWEQMPYIKERLLSWFPDLEQNSYIYESKDAENIQLLKYLFDKDEVM